MREAGRQGRPGDAPPGALCDPLRDRGLRHPGGAPSRGRRPHFLAAEQLADVLQRLAPAQTAERGLVAGDVADDLVRVDPGVVAQGPADRLADEKVAVGTVGLDAVIEEAEVDRATPADLADDRAPPLPEIGRERPRSE